MISISLSKHQRGAYLGCQAGIVVEQQSDLDLPLVSLVLRGEGVHAEHQLSRVACQVGVNGVVVRMVQQVEPFLAVLGRHLLKFGSIPLSVLQSNSSS